MAAGGESASRWRRGVPMVGDDEPVTRPPEEAL
jgi:hypothetical protein